MIAQDLSSNGIIHNGVARRGKQGIVLCEGDVIGLPKADIGASIYSYNIGSFKMFMFNTIWTRRVQIRAEPETQLSIPTLRGQELLI